MRYLLIAALLSQPLFAADNCNEDFSNVVSTAKALSLPNCYSKKNARKLARDPETFCNSDCKEQFVKIYGQEPKLAVTDLQKKYLSSSIEEYKKNIINNLIDVAKLRSLPSTGADFQKSMMACDAKAHLKKISACKSKTAKAMIQDGHLFDEIQNSLATELAKIVSEDKSYKPESTLLTRSAQKCFIPEKDILLFTSQTVEEDLSPELISFFQTLDPSKNVADTFDSAEFQKLYKRDSSSLKVSLLNHPILSRLMASPKDFSAFFKSVPKPYDAKALRSKLYHKQNGELMDQQMAKNCAASFDAFYEAVCSDEFEKGKLSLDQFNNLKKLNFPQPTDSDFASSEELVDVNTSVLALCEKPIEGAKNLTQSLKSISSSLIPEYADMTLPNYQLQKFESEIGKSTDYLCSNSDSCDENLFGCRVLKKYKKSQEPNSFESRLAKSHNEEVNKLLRSMIGDVSKIDSKTKQILVSNGILPKEDGTFVAQPDIPERRPEYFSQPAGQLPQLPTTKISNIPQSGQAPTGRQNFYDSNYSNVKNSGNNQNQPTVPDISDIVQNTSELKNIQDEIRRRLTDFGGKPVSREAATKMVNDAFKSQGQGLKPSQTSTIVDRMLPSSQQSFSPTLAPTLQPENRAQVSGGDSLREKWKKEQENNALMGMAGAQAKNSRTPASEAVAIGPKEMTKVALNIPEETQINLSEAFNQKIDQNDSETQLLKVLLKNHNNFLLQVKSVNFKVVFLDNNKFSILLESGDNKTAEQLRPQLEMFLKKLKA